MNTKDLLLSSLLFLLAFSLRFYDLSYPGFKWMDEAGHVPAASNYWSNGQSDPDNWEHPPLRHIIEYGFLQVFGDNPYGWRMRNVLFGALAVVLTYLFALRVTESRETAFMAGVLLATDPLHIVLSRFTFDEIYSGALFLAALLLYIMHDRKSSRLIWSAIFIGMAMATKWYYAPCWLLLCFLALREDGNYRDPRTAVFIVSTYFMLPLSVYLISYYPWFGRGYSLNEFVDFTINAYHSLQSYQSYNYPQQLLFLSHLSAGEWFIRPVIMGQGAYLDAGMGEFIIYAGNFPIWILTLPSMMGLAVVAIRKRSLLIALPVLFFLATYGLYVFVQRPVFIYSAAPLLPFAFTAIATMVAKTGERYGRSLQYALLAGMVLWCLFLYPLVTAKKVPIAPYRSIIEMPGVRKI